MFKAILEDISLLRESFSAIAEIIDEGTFHIKKDGISLVCPDRAVIAMVDFLILPTAFESYTCDKDIEIGLNIPRMLQFIRKAKPEDLILILFNLAKIPWLNSWINATIKIIIIQCKKPKTGNRGDL